VKQKMMKERRDFLEEMSKCAENLKDYAEGAQRNIRDAITFVDESAKDNVTDENRKEFVGNLKEATGCFSDAYADVICATVGAGAVEVISKFIGDVYGEEEEDH